MMDGARIRRWPFLVAALLLAGGWLGVRSVSQAEPVPAARPLAEFPQTVGGRWEGREVAVEPAVLNVLKLSDYLMRMYRPVPERAGATRLEGFVDRTPVWLYVGFYQSQRTGATYHSPKNCLPGAGWQFVEAAPVTVSVPGHDPITINRVLIEKGLDRQAILYWYQDRGRVIASEYRAKGYLMWDAMTKHRTDGALVRISIPVTTTSEAAYRQGVAFLLDVWPLIWAALPA